MQKAIVILQYSSQNITICVYGSFKFKLSNGQVQTLNTCLYAYMSKNVSILKL